MYFWLCIVFLSVTKLAFIRVQIGLTAVLLIICTFWEVSHESETTMTTLSGSGGGSVYSYITPLAGNLHHCSISGEEGEKRKASERLCPRKANPKKMVDF